MQDHLYTWTFNRDSRLIRFYLWAWNASAADLNFCKLFWGMLFSPLAVFFHGLESILSPVVKFIGRFLPEPEEETPAQKEARWIREAEEEKRKAREKARLQALKERAKKEKGPSALSRSLDHFIQGVDKVAEFFQTHETVSKTIVTIATVLAWAAAGLAALAIIGGIVFVFYTWTLMVLKILAIITGFVTFVALVSLLIYYLDTSGKAKAAGKRIKGFFSKIGEGFDTVTFFFETGYHATKYRTCPRIKIIGEDSQPLQGAASLKKV